MSVNDQRERSGLKDDPEAVNILTGITDCYLKMNVRKHIVSMSDRDKNIQLMYLNHLSVNVLTSRLTM